MLIGEYTHTMDDKNRVSLPAKFRKEMGKKVILAPGLDGCVSMYTEAEWKKFSTRLSEGSVLRSDDRNFNRYIFGGAVESDVDTSGRILIPDFLKEKGGLGTKISIIGVQNRAEIWNEKKWKEFKKSVESQADTLAEKLGQIGVL
ncbi:MAG: division/cell wall cluster transcriptional repressor MraZ [Candidatus Pacebacteria bacterium]|nr:division/cell wall cluster transcriptional repressor MraZ [Candidatus Paceibacterota bacterium]